MVQSSKKDKKLEKVKIDKKNYKVIIGTIVAIIILALSGFSFTGYKVYNEPTNKLKRYLSNNGYECGKSLCRKEKDKVTYSVSYKKDSYQIIKDLYTINISKKKPYIVFKVDDKVCTYEVDDYKAFSLVDNTFTYDKDCAKYVDEVNKGIKDYKNILSNARVDINDLTK